MPTFEHTVKIAAPIKRVFAFDSNPENWSRTMPSLQDLEIIEETDDRARMRVTYKLLGITLDTEMELSIVESNKHIVVTIESSGMNGEVHNYFSETDAGTQIVHRTDYEFRESLRDRLLEPVAMRYNNRQFKNHLQNTKDIVEAEVPAETVSPA